MCVCVCVFIKTIIHFCFPESSFGVTSTKLYRAHVGKADLHTHKWDLQLLRSQFVFITFSRYFYVTSLSSEFSQSDLSPSRSGVGGVHCPGA